ncbi:MAG: hypothetical protein KC435_08865 [Thermomicrobiales bacterium]|nr:hypothetical protein [Thermomicrobiales bacterium]
MHWRTYKEQATIAAHIAVIVLVSLLAHDVLMAAGVHSTSPENHHELLNKAHHAAADESADCGPFEGLNQAPPHFSVSAVPSSIDFMPLFHLPCISGESDLEVPPQDASTRRALLQVYLN